VYGISSIRPCTLLEEEGKNDAAINRVSPAQGVCRRSPLPLTLYEECTVELVLVVPLACLGCLPQQERHILMDGKQPLGIYTCPIILYKNPFACNSGWSVGIGLCRHAQHLRTQTLVYE
jgi:hypothetical protein